MTYCVGLKINEGLVFMSYSYLIIFQENGKSVRNYGSILLPLATLPHHRHISTINEQIDLSWNEIY